jgi:hypothetical protein
MPWRPSSLAEALGEPLHRAGVQAACPGLAEAERFGDVVEAFAFEVVAAHQDGFIFGQLGVSPLK